MRKPLIGIIPLIDIQRESYWMLPGYMKGLEEAGAIPVMLPLSQDEEALAQLAEELDGFLFTGGQDVEPSCYAEEKKETCQETCPDRDGMEQKLLRYVLEQDKPVLGICRGIQLINAALGGTLYQDIPTEYPSKIEHHQTPPYDKIAHMVFVERKSPLWKMVEQEEIPVNSYHHQAIRELAPGLKAAAKSEDGLIEAVYMEGKRLLLALQWHPEFSYRTDGNARKIFRGFVEACRS